MQTRQVKHLIRAAVIAGGVLAATTLGLACLRYSFGEPLMRLSYDLPFLWRTTLDTHDITLVYLDEYSAKQLNQPLDDVWNRALHVRLLPSSDAGESATRLLRYCLRRTCAQIPLPMQLLQSPFAGMEKSFLVRGSTS